MYETPYLFVKGDEIRALKAAKAEKDAIMPKVGELNVSPSSVYNHSLITTLLISIVSYCYWIDQSSKTR